MSGFRATVVVRDPADCPVASASASTDEPIDSVNWTRASGRENGDEVVVEEFELPASTSPDTITKDSSSDIELMPVQASEHETVYRFERNGTGDCACEVIEETGTPISSVRAQEGALLLSFRTLELDDIADIVDDLRDRFDGVLVEDLTQDHEESSSDPVIVDREELTDRQQEILETAYEMGYFDYPKGANATDVADELGVARSTFTEHLAAAETKLMDAIVAN